jgi:protein-disulfide isomerase
MTNDGGLSAFRHLGKVTNSATLSHVLFLVAVSDLARRRRTRRMRSRLQAVDKSPRPVSPMPPRSPPGRVEVSMVLMRRLAGMIAAAAALALAHSASAVDKVGSAEIALGSPGAPVTVIEYASVTCPHCARFNAEVVPLLKKRYVDTGKVRYVFREAPIHPDLDTAGFLVARCAGPERYLAVTDALFRAQPALFEKQDLHAWLMAGAAAGGLDEAAMRACISDVAAIQAFNTRADHTLQVDKIDSTPTVLVNGARLDAKGAEYSITDIDAAVQPLLGGKSPASRRHAHGAPVH